MANLRIFVSYSHADTKQKDRLLKHLTPLESSVDFDVWDDQRIQPGDKWEPAIENALADASVAVLLISADFLSSEFIRHKELPTMLQRRASEDMRLYPVLAKPCAWQAVPWIQATQLRPVAAKPVWRSGGRYADDELARIALELYAILQLAIHVRDAAGEAARQKAEQEKREIEKKIADEISKSPPVENAFAKTMRGSTEGQKNSVEHLNSDFDREQAQKIYEEIAADHQKFAAERSQILQELQTKVFAIMQDVTVDKSKLRKADFSKWDEYLRS